MIVVMKHNADEAQIDSVRHQITSMGLTPHLSRGKEKTIIGAIGNERKIQKEHLASLEGVEKVIPILKPFKLASREFKPDSTFVSVDGNGTRFGGKNVIVIAGTCAVENYETTLAAAQAAKRVGATVLRGGAFKPRTSPYSFQGLGEEGLKILARVGKEVGLPVITECLARDHVDIVSEFADIVQIGTRNMQNFAMLEEIGRQKKPVLLKRGMSSTIEEFLMSAEYILASGNPNVILCERGIRTFERATRNTCDISAVPLLKILSHLPVVVDPSHATGKRELITPVSLAAVAAGADGLMIEIHPDPDNAMCDGHQSLRPEQFDDLMTGVRAVAAAVGRSI